MGKKYIVVAFEYPFPGYYKQKKLTNSFVVALFYFLVYSKKYFVVDLQRRKKEEK